MRFIMFKLGNRVGVKTIKKNYCKVTYFTFKDARKLLYKIQENGWTVDIDNNTRNIL